MSFDSQHWYAQDGTPCHYQGDRPTNLRDARKQGLVPSVSTVLSILAKPALVQWQIRQAVLAALTLPRGDDDEDTFLRRIVQDGRREAEEAARDGTAIHQAIEASFAGERVPEAYRPHVAGVRRMLEDNYPGVTDWVIERSFAHPAGFGGKVDLYSPSARLIGDHKSSSITSAVDKKLAWDQHWQLGGYSLGLEMPDARGFNLFVSRTEPGYVVFHEWEPHKMDEGRAVFLAALELWKRLKNFDGGWS